MNELPKLLMLSGTPPGRHNPGELMIADLWSLYPREKLCGFFTRNPEWFQSHLENIPVELRDYPMRAVEVTYRRELPMGQGRLMRGAKQLASNQRFKREVRGAIEEAVAFGQKQGVDAVWALLNFPSVCVMAAEVAERLGKPLLPYVMDDRFHLAQYFNLDPFVRRSVIEGAARAIRMAKRCAVAGDSMGERYEREFSVPCTNLWHGVEASLWQPVGEQVHDASMLRIGFAGSVSAPRAFACLLDMLGERGWEIAGRQVSLRLMGGRFDLKMRHPGRVECRGFCSIEQTVKQLHECDVLYLPQPYGAEHENFRQLSFPVKYMTYLAAGRPVVLHAQEDASLVRFGEGRELFEHCRELEGEALARAFERVVMDADYYARLARNGRGVLERYFSKEAVRGLFAEFLEVPKEALLPARNVFEP